MATKQSKLKEAFYLMWKLIIASVLSAVAIGCLGVVAGTLWSIAKVGWKLGAF